MDHRHPVGAQLAVLGEDVVHGNSRIFSHDRASVRHLRGTSIALVIFDRVEPQLMLGMAFRLAKYFFTRMRCVSVVCMQWGTLLDSIPCAVFRLAGARR